jgi:hypothetical protein
MDGTFVHVATKNRTDTGPGDRVKTGGKGVNGRPRLPRPALAAANSSSMGAADGVIMPTIITAHIANVKKTSAGPHRISMFMPIAAIILSCIMSADIWRSR